MYTGISIALIVFGLIWFVLCLFPTLMIAISMIGSPERYNNVSIGWSTWLQSFDGSRGHLPILL